MLQEANGGDSFGPEEAGGAEARGRSGDGAAEGAGAAPHDVSRLLFTSGHCISLDLPPVPLQAELAALAQSEAKQAKTVSAKLAAKQVGGSNKPAKGGKPRKP